MLLVHAFKNVDNAIKENLQKQFDLLQNLKRKIDYAYSKNNWSIAEELEKQIKCVEMNIAKLGR